MGINQKILAALVALRTEVLDGDYPVTGICSAVVDQIRTHVIETDRIIPIVRASLPPAILKWPGFSGDLDYPVPHPEIPAEEAYNLYSYSYRGKWLWASPEYGMKRRELLDFLITYFEGEVNAGS